MNNLPRYRTLDMWHYRNLRKKLNKKFFIIYGIAAILFLLAIIVFAINDDLILKIDFKLFLIVMCAYIILIVGSLIWFCVETVKLLQQFKDNKNEGRFSALIYTKFDNSTQLYNEVCKALQQMGYELQNYNGEEVFCNNQGSLASLAVLTFPKYIKIQIQGNVIIATCWIISNKKEYALGDYPECESLTVDMDNFSNYFDF